MKHTLYFLFCLINRCKLWQRHSIVQLWVLYKLFSCALKISCFMKTFYAISGFFPRLFEVTCIYLQKLISLSFLVISSILWWSLFTDGYVWRKIHVMYHCQILFWMWLYMCVWQLQFIYLMGTVLVKQLLPTLHPFMSCDSCSSTLVSSLFASISMRCPNVIPRISCGMRYTSNSLSRDSSISTAVMESKPSSVNVEFGLIVFRSRIPAWKLTFMIYWSFSRYT